MSCMLFLNSLILFLGVIFADGPDNSNVMMSTLKENCYITTKDGQTVQICPKNVINDSLNPSLFISHPEMVENLKQEVNKVNDPSSVINKIQNFLDAKSLDSLPTPKDMFDVVRSKLKIYESLEDDIKDALHNIELIVSRVDVFLNETKGELVLIIKKMKELLMKLKTSKDPGFQAELTSKIYTLNEKNRNLSDEYQKAFRWMNEAIMYFKDLYRYRGGQ